MEEKFYTPEPRTHLDLKIPGAKPIIACMAEELSDFSDDEFRALLDSINEKKQIWNKEGSKGAVCILSEVNEENKPIEGLDVCTGLIVTGIDINTGNNVSFVTHEYPGSVLNKGKKNFIEMLNRRLSEIKSSCIPHTIDAVIIGGDYNQNKKDRENKPDQENWYEESINQLKNEVFRFFEFHPTVVNGPKYNGGGEEDNAIYNTSKRRLYFSRKKINKNGIDFPASDIGKVKDAWEGKHN